MGCGDEAISWPQSSHLPPLIPQFREALRPRCNRVRGAQTRYPADSESYSRTHSVNEAGKLQDRAPGALLPPQNATIDRPGNRRASGGVLALRWRRKEGEELF